MSSPDLHPHHAVARSYRAIANELERATAHCHTAADHLEAHQVPRGCAHGMAVLGHLLAAREQLDALIREHAAHAEP